MERNHPSYQTNRSNNDRHSWYNHCPFNRIVSEVKWIQQALALAITAASKAFSAIKAGFSAGREIESMGKDLSRWMGAISDIDNAREIS